MSRLCLALALALCTSAPALAHKVNVFALVEGRTVRGEGYFAGGTRAQNAAVEIVDAQGRVLAQGATGADGAFAVALPEDARAPLTIVLKAGEGHQGTYALGEKDVGLQPPAQPQAPAAPQAATPAQAQPQPSSAPSQAPAPAQPQTEAAPPRSASPAPQPSSGLLPAMDEARLTALVEAATARAVEEKLAPIRVALARLTAQDHDVRLRDVIGGLGWIMGLVGLAAWLKRPK